MSITNKAQSLLTEREKYEIDTEHVQKKLINQCLRENLEIQVKLEAAHQRIDEQAKVIAAMAEMVETLTDRMDRASKYIQNLKGKPDAPN